MTADPAYVAGGGSLDWYQYLLVVGGGFAAGFINTLAGSGSLITLPLLIFLGLPANIANGTNRIAILLQNVVAVKSFHTEKLLDLRGGLMLAVPAVLGAIVGAHIAVNLDETVMRRIIGVLMLIMLLMLLVKPKRWLEGRQQIDQSRFSWTRILIFFGIGVYGGFIQAGVGIFLLAGLVLAAGYDLNRANPVKLLIVLCFTVFALVVFLINDQVHWGIGLTLALGNMLGAWVAVKTAVKRGAVFVRWLLLIVVAVSAVVLLGIPDLF